METFRLISVLMKYILLILLMTALCACSTTKYYSPSNEKAINNKLEYGDRVVLYMKDGSSKKVRVLNIEDGVLYHKRGQILLDDIGSIRIRRISATRTVLGIVGIVAGVGYILFDKIFPAILSDSSESYSENQ